ncbi:dicarboxylate transporter/tellurite-resistance protein TehA [Azorhizobium oxalatiphilum]|uniref:Dicarboxylate transporter/tellurite-resistance protein TehA n=1 Tax=Azorhizobium oxalatiphilum TaxID=980631 RepID=A0A917CER3_9HYPH|nr:dicarboxylate transporter/tellurite-resistance protein TehA [Azorhizobium oxalatiphilum]GGF86008.1 dicarboxylate transporter/tellurite-resistance protein TehA [Azorhizobium oxalatiphilum]
MPRQFKWPRVPASFFGIVLGLVGLGNSWRAAHELWGLPAVIGEVLMLAGAVVWFVLVVLYAAKWFEAKADVIAEARHPVQCCFIGLAGVSTMLMALAAHPYSHAAAVIFFAVGCTFTLGFALWRTGILWQGDRDPAATTPVLYLPTVAGSFVTAMALSALGHADWGRLAFGAGFFSWLAIESVLVHRLYTSPALAPALRPTLGIQLAPPTVGAAAYLSVTSGPPDMMADCLIGYGLFQAVLLARLLPWIREQSFSAAYWAFTFGLTALATAMLRMTQRGDTGPVATLAPAVLTIVTAILAVIVTRTLWLLVSGRILPAAPATPTAVRPS